MSADLSPFFASLESVLVFAAIVLISALSNWLKQRQERKQAEARGELEPGRAGPAPRPLFDDEELDEAPPGRPVPKPLDWQEELRRLLEGDQPRPAPPPLPPPLPRPEPPVAPRPAPVFDEAPPIRTAPVSTPPRPAVVTVAETQEGPLGGQGRLQESAAAFLRGAQVAESAEARLQTVVQQVASAKAKEAARPVFRRSTEAANRLRALLLNRTTAREAVLASVILGPPRGLEKNLPSHG
ncbi:MAG: hypothetical protein IPM17_07560 [Verrucomicrobia bacterium]|nr:hypothetical protein [Verrucomicrobiota bacterium]